MDVPVSHEVEGIVSFELGDVDDIEIAVDDTDFEIAVDDTDFENDDLKFEVDNVNVETEVENIRAVVTPHCRQTIWRAKCKLRGILTGDTFDNMLLLLAFNNEHGLDDINEELKKLSLLKLDIRRNRYRILRLKEIFLSLRQDVMHEVIKFWLENILNSPTIESLFNSVGVNIPEHLLPKSITVSRHAVVVSKRYLNASSQSGHDLRKNAIKFILGVAKECNLSLRDANILSSATNCSSKSARRVLEAIENGTVNELLQLRRERID